MKRAIIHDLEKEQTKTAVPDFNVGDTVRVHTRIIEGGKERVQVFTGTVIARKGSGLTETFSVHRVAYGEGMERVFLLHSPRIAMIEIVRYGDVRRSKLYYLRGTHGKKSKVKTKLGISTRAIRREEKVLEEQLEEASQVEVVGGEEEMTEVIDIAEEPSEEEEKEAEEKEAEGKKAEEKTEGGESDKK